MTRGAILNVSFLFVDDDFMIYRKRLLQFLKKLESRSAGKVPEKKVECRTANYRMILEKREKRCQSYNIIALAEHSRTDNHAST